MNEHLWNFSTIFLTVVGALGSAAVYFWRVAKDHYAKFDRIEKVSHKALVKMRKWEPFLKNLAPNGGKSLFDSISRLEQSVQFMQDQLAVNNYLKRAILPDSPSFESDRQGRWTWTNAALDELCGTHDGDLLGQAWIRAVQADLREEAQAEWFRAVKAGVPYHWETTLINEVTVKAIEVTYRASPIVNQRNEVVGYFGSVSRRV